MALVTKLRYWRLPRKPFWEHTKKNEATGCIEWQGRKHPQGYGCAPLFIGEPGETRAHRKSWAMAHGDIPNGLHVLHKCDNTSCVNVEHLFLGTDMDNTKDKYSKRRNINLAGAEHGRSKLIPEDVARIRESSLFGASRASLGRSYGVNEATIAAIVKRKTWKHVE